MKSLNSLTYSDLFTPEIMGWIKNEGFKLHSNDSYCFPREDDELKWEDKCYHKFVDCDDVFSVGVYIFGSGIGVDIDYGCGGNSSSCFWRFSNYNSFEEVYDNMVDFINDIR